MIPEAPLERTGHGLVPTGDGWFVVNACEARWGDDGELGVYTRFEGDMRFPQLGINISVIEPGRPMCMYHYEADQEDFLILAGEALLIVEVDGPAAFTVVDAAFVTHFGYFEETFEDWWAQQQADDTWDPSLGLVAELDGTIVGYSNNGVIDGTGYVFELAVAPQHQGRGIGRALLKHSFASFAARGNRTGRLGVDTENVTGAHELYRSVGMVPVREQRVFEKRIESG